MSGLSLTKRQLTARYLRKLAGKVLGRRITVKYHPILASEMDKNAAREREYNQIIARHLREAREREAAGEPLTMVQEIARFYREREELDEQYELEAIDRNFSPHYPRRVTIQTVIDNRARARLEADRAEEERDLPPYTIPAPLYKSRKTPWRTFKSGVSKLLTKKKTLSPAPPSSPAPPLYLPRYSDNIEVGGRRSSGRRSRKKTRKLRRH